MTKSDKHSWEIEPPTIVVTHEDRKAAFLAFCPDSLPAAMEKWMQSGEYEDVPADIGKYMNGNAYLYILARCAEAIAKTRTELEAKCARAVCQASLLSQIEAFEYVRDNYMGMDDEEDLFDKIAALKEKVADGNY